MTPAVRFFRFALAAGFLAGCAPTSPKPSVSQVLVAPGSATISVGQSVRIVATASTSPSGSAYAVTWTTSDASTATVDSTGLVVGMGYSPGVSICATVSTGSMSSSVRSCATLTIQPAPVCFGPDGTLIPAADTMRVGDVAQFQIPTAQLSGRSAGEIRWTLDNPAPARVDSLTGVVTAVSAGGTDVIATDRLSGSPCPHVWRATVLVH
jgi:uncharacterized protein YjdB